MIITITIPITIIIKMTIIIIIIIIIIITYFNNNINIKQSKTVEYNQNKGNCLITLDTLLKTSLKHFLMRYLSLDTYAIGTSITCAL